MKILHIIETLGRGGAERVLVTLLPALQDRGHRCELAVLWPPYDLADELERRGVRVIRLGIRHRWHVADAMRALVPLARSGYDVMHAHLFFAGFYAALTSFFSAGPRRVVTFHNCDYDSYPADRCHKRVVKAVNGFLMRRRTDALVAISLAVAENYRRHLAVTEVSVIANAVDFEALPPPPVASRAPRNAAPVVTVPGRLVHEKGHRYLLEAAGLLDREALPFRLNIVGDGPLRHDIERQIAALGVGERVSLTPSLPHAELMELLQESDLVVVPSTHEGFGMVALEAMALGRAVLATSVGGLVDLVEHGVTGLLVPAADPLRLADAMRELLGDRELRERLGTAARERVAERFDVKGSAALLEKIYLGKKRSASCAA